MNLSLTRLKKIISRHWLEMLLVFVAGLAGLSVVAELAAGLAGSQLVLALGVTAVIVTLIIEITRYRTFKHLDLLRRQAETSGALGQEITANPDFEGLLADIVHLLQTKFQYDYVGLCLVNEAHMVTSLVQVGQVGRQLTIGAVLEPRTTLGTAVFQQRIVCVNNSVCKLPGVAVDLLPRMRSELALPLLAGQKLLGVLDIQSREAVAFEADHILALQSLAAQTAVAIRNATLYQREADRRHLAETLYDIGLTLSGTLDREAVLGNILEQLASVVPYDRGSLLLHQDQELEIVAARGFPENSEPLQIRIPLDSGDPDDIYFTIHRTQRPLVVPDLSKQSNWIHVQGLPEAKSWLGVPLIHEKQVIGMLSLVREVDDAYGSEDALPVTTFAMQAAVALHNADLYNQIDLFNHQLAYEVEQRTQAVLQLARLDQAKADFINVAAHELRTPLTTIKGYSQMLLQERTVAETPYQQELVSGIFQGAMRLHEVVNNMLNVARIDNRSLDLHFQPVSLAHLLERINQTLASALAERRLTLEIESLTAVPELQADVDALHSVFNHLLLNAIKYTPDGGQISVTNRLIGEGTPSHVEIIVSDTGIGISPDALELIFTKFYQTGQIGLHSSGRTKFKGGGPGLGLAIVRGIVEAHNGHVWADSAEYNESSLPGSQFYVVLPIRQ